MLEAEAARGSDRVRGGLDVLLLRHAPTSWNDQQRRQGWTDEPLTDDGRQAAQAWAAGSCVAFAAVLASDLRRARETATLVAAGLGLGAVQALPGLREQDQGAWTGLTKEQIKRRWPDRLRERPRRPVDGEPPEVVLDRVLATLGWLAAAQPGCRVLAITHSEVIRILERALKVAAPPVPHLEGRWLRLASRGGDTEPSLGSVRAGNFTAGRARLTDGECAAPASSARR